jgi:hypothetical protein
MKRFSQALKEKPDAVDTLFPAAYNEVKDMATSKK